MLRSIQQFAQIDKHFKEVQNVMSKGTFLR